MQQELPFTITKVATRSEVRNMKDTVTDVSDRLKKVDFSIMRIRPEFNQRIKPDNYSEEDWEKELDIPNLANGIFISCQTADPIIGDILPDGTFLVNEGERRFRAIRYLLAQGLDTYPNGQPVSRVEVMLNPTYFTEQDRFIRNFTSQNKKKLKPMEIAYGALRLKEEFKMTHEAIANTYNVSRQTIDNYILATTLPKDRQQLINDKLSPLSVEIAAIRTDKKEKKEKKEKFEDNLDEDLNKKPKEKEPITENDDDIFKQQDNSISSSSTRLQEDKSSNEVIYKEDEDKIWTRALKMIVSLTEQDKSPEYIKGELKLAFTIQNRK